MKISELSVGDVLLKVTPLPSGGCAFHRAVVKAVYRTDGFVCVGNALGDVHEVDAATLVQLEQEGMKVATSRNAETFVRGLSDKAAETMVAYIESGVLPRAEDQSDSVAVPATSEYQSAKKETLH